MCKCGEGGGERSGWGNCLWRVLGPSPWVSLLTLSEAALRGLRQGRFCLHAELTDFGFAAATTWSRLRHCDIPGQVPLRTRDYPAGRAGLSSAQQKKVNDANRCMEITVWFAEQSLLCSARPVALLFVFPKDFGGHHREGLASPWALQELRQLQSVNDAQRRAAFLCRLDDSEYRRPLGFLGSMVIFLQPTL